MNKLLLAAAIIFLAGCVGSNKPHNPMKRNGEHDWWAKTTVGVSDADNPWNKFIPTRRVEDWSNPWSNFQEPRLFPKNWKQNKKRVDTDDSRSIIPNREVY